MAKGISANWLAVAALMWSVGCGRGEGSASTAGVDVTRQAVTGAYCTGLTADFCDDFQDGNATSPAWTVRDQAVASDFTVVKDGDYVYRQGDAGTSNTRRISTAGSSWGKVMVEAKVKILSFNSNTANWVGLYARYSTSANTGYIFALGGDGKVSLRKKGTSTAGDCINATYPASGCSQTVSPAIALNTWYTLKFVLNGSLLTGYLNGIRVIETTDTTYTTGVIGVGSNFSGQYHRMPGLGWGLRRGRDLHGDECGLSGRQYASGGNSVPGRDRALRQGRDMQWNQCGLSGRHSATERYGMQSRGRGLRQGGDLQRDQCGLSRGYLPGQHDGVPGLGRGVRRGREMHRDQRSLSSGHIPFKRDSV
jgi:hypothetical protein